MCAISLLILATSAAACASCPVTLPSSMNCAYSCDRLAAAGSLTTGIANAPSWVSRLVGSSDSTTRSGLYDAMASTLGLLSSRLVRGAPGG